MREKSGFDELKKVLVYNHSAKNLKNCEPFERLNQKYISLQKQYANSFQELYSDVSLKENRREYSKGGEAIHRGFYSPSSLDLVIGGCSRGRILKLKPKSNKYDYEYVFDDMGRIICSKKYGGAFDATRDVIAIELFVYECNRVLSFVYETPSNILSFISECQYNDGALVRYENAICGAEFGKKDCIEVNVEIFEFFDCLLKSVYWYRYTPSIKLLNQNKFTFSRDEEGYLSTYTVEQLGGYSFDTSVNFKQKTYNVKLRRK